MRISGTSKLYFFAAHLVPKMMDAPTAIQKIFPRPNPDKSGKLRLLTS